MRPIIKILYINFLISGSDRIVKICQLYESCIGRGKIDEFNAADDFYHKYHTGKELIPIKPISNKRSL